MNLEKLQKLQAQVRVGGKGTPRRKVKKVMKHAGTAADDKALQSELKKLQFQQIPQCEEVNMFLDGGRVIHITRPIGNFYFNSYNKRTIIVQASLSSNAFSITGSSAEKGTFIH